ncbi:dihydrodipicolinate synthase family protein [Alistipes provencensis]|uniref:dihydrodipicolinate synthase family protein n=1 Tax=Alistipes provencensis TaxID=1816676 RepID=UPI0007EDDB41|nr:dihydrodipicolinate synthase family protein [Alistipes provencensis]
MNAHTMIKLSGLIPAVFTPFDKNGAVNLPQIRPYADKLVTDGADGVFVCGSTGECTSMTVAERKSVLEAWVEAAAGRMRVIAHVGGTCQADCIELARHAAGQRVDAVGAIAPFYFKPASVEELVDFYKPIAAAIAPIPFYTYHMPSVTGVNLPMKEFLEKGSREIPNLNGIKFTSNNFMEMLECIRLEDGRFDILNGFDEMLLCGMAVGARGGVGSTYNYSLSTYRNLYDAFLAGDIERARVFQQESVDIVHVIIRHGGGVRGGKAIMNHLGIDCGDCRLPFAPYTESEMHRLGEELDRIGFAK